MAEKLYKLEIPESKNNSAAESWEWMLVWFGKKGEPYQWLFTDWELKKTFETLPINERNSTNVRSLILDKLETVLLVAEDITQNEFDSISTVFESKDVFRLLTTGETQRLSIVSTENIRKQSTVRTRLEITVQKSREALST